MNDEKLILLVSKYECLYDISKSSYSDRIMKGNAWEEISKCLNTSAKECRERWKKLRDNFRKALSNRKGKSGDGAKKTRLIKFEKELSFVTPFIRNRDQISNISSDDSQPETPSMDGSQPETPGSSNAPQLSNCESPPFPSTSGKSKTVQHAKDVGTIFQEYLEKKEGRRDNSLRNFFLSMSDTVETFPKEVQARIKRDVFQIVNEAELSLHQNNSDLSYVSPLISAAPNQPTYQQTTNQSYVSQNYPDNYGYSTTTQNSENNSGIN